MCFCWRPQAKLIIRMKTITKVCILFKVPRWYWLIKLIKNFGMKGPFPGPVRRKHTNVRRHKGDHCFAKVSACSIRHRVRAKKKIMFHSTIRRTGNEQLDWWRASESPRWLGGWSLDLCPISRSWGGAAIGSSCNRWRWWLQGFWRWLLVNHGTHLLIRLWLGISLSQVMMMIRSSYSRWPNHDNHDDNGCW